MSDTGNRAWVVLAIAVLVVVTGCTGTERNANSETSAPPGAETTDTVERAPLESYRIRYQITELDVVRTETIEVRRPYLSRRISRRDSTILEDRITNRSGLWSARDEGWQQLSVGRRLAAADDRLLGSVELLAATGLAERLSDGEILDRTCARFRVREPIGIPATAKPTEDDHVDYCVDSTDVILEETWTLDGTVIRHRVATTFEMDPDLPDERFEASPVVPPPSGAPRVVEIEFTETIEEDLITHVPATTDLRADGAVVTVHLDQFGQPFDGTVIRFFTTDWSAVTVEEIETNRLGDSGEPIETSLGGGTRTVTLNRITVSVDLGNGVSLIVAGPDPELIDRILGTTVVHHRGS